MINSFKDHVVESSSSDKNLHMNHIQNSVIYGGVNGCRDAIKALRSLRDMLQGNVSNSHDVTLKWDGRVAVFVGIDPSDGKFFVAKKSIFNKNPVVYKSIAEIEADKSGDLATQLSLAFSELKDIGITNIIQGDIMFTQSDLKTETIDGDKYLTFQPNTIVYAVPYDSALSDQIRKASIGIVFHTTYSGDSFQNLKATYSCDISKFKNKDSIWIKDASIRDLSGRATLTKDETDNLNSILSRAGSIFREIGSSTLKQIESNPSFAETIETFDNTLIRKGKRIINTMDHVNNLIAWSIKKHDDLIAGMKSEKGKISAQNRKDEYLSFFSDENKKNLDLIYQLQNSIVYAKLIIIDKLDAIKSMKTFLKTKSGFKVTGNEGFVVIDHMRGGAMKLVDQMSFSHANFNPEIIKGWNK